MTFGLITEGISEYTIIKHLISKYFKEDDPEIRPIQPRIDLASEKQVTAGGWHKVLQYCQSDELSDAFIESDYLIIQIDTDYSQISPFDISHTKIDNQLKSVDELHADVVSKLLGLISPEIIQHRASDIFFAISIHTIECWLLPLYSIHHKAATTGCREKLNTELRKRDIPLIPQNDKNSPAAKRAYQTILSNWRNRKNIHESCKHNAGFQKFIESLNNLANSMSE